MVSSVIFVCLTALFLADCVRGQVYSHECSVWNRVSTILQNERHVSNYCTRNSLCTGVHCSGTYSYQGFLTQNQRFELFYCFDVALLPCDRPLGLTFHLDIPDVGLHYSQTIHNSTDLKIPGLRYDLGEAGAAEGYVHVDMTHVFIHGRPHVKIGMTFKVRITGPLSDIGEWPGVLQRNIMEDVIVPVPDCNGHVPPSPSPGPHTCVKYTTTTSVTHVIPTKKASTKPRPGGHPFSVISTMEAPTKQIPGDINADCIETYAFSCGDNMYCFTSHGDKKGRCRCLPNFKAVSGRICVPIEDRSTTPPIIDEPVAGPVPVAAGSHATATATEGSSAAASASAFDDYTGDTAASHGKTTTYIIVGVCLGGLLILGLIGVVLFIIYRRHKLRYGNHQLLLNEEDEEPVDVST